MDDLFQVKGGGGQRQDRLFADGLPEGRATESGNESGLLRDRIRNHGDGQRHGCVPGKGARQSVTSRCWCRSDRGRLPSPAFCNRPGTACRDSSVLGTFAPSWAWREYQPIAARYGVPIVITGFEPVDLLEGVLLAVRQLEQGRAEVENQYARACGGGGNVAARKMIAQGVRSPTEAGAA